ncbi:MAG: glycosyltransferase family 2 protein [Actinomycetota bacterium]|nr:glycosyltransferase family 2 protein [Actinomycetota bacterium]
MAVLRSSERSATQSFSAAPSANSALSYVLPYRSTGVEDFDELTAYLEWLASRAEVIVVDGSPARTWQKHNRRLDSLVVHIAPRTNLDHANGKVNGVITGIERATNDRVIVADDDVRYDEVSLAQMASSLDDADLVRPQNYFVGHPWHALWDSGRTLLNRAVGADYPGTLGVRRSTFLAAGGYDGDVLFENLELIRTIEEAGGVSTSRLDLYVGRVPPDCGHFWRQRTRQAYDDFAQPLRLALFLSIAPAAMAALLSGRKRVVAGGLVATIALAERGRRRAGGAERWPAAAALMSPLWVCERAVCSWLAVGNRLFRGGVRYRDKRLKVAANSRRTIRSRLGRSRP